MEDFKSRLKKEKEELESNTLKLGSFLISDKIESLSEGNQILLRRQHEAMTLYLDILIIRIELLS